MTMNKETNKVLGIMIRSNRIEKGYSLRELGDRANISHTLISNIEKGKQVPSNETLRDLFEELDLAFYDDNDLHVEFATKSQLIYSHLFNHDYEDAGKLLQELEKKNDIYMYSVDLVDYVILKGLYYSLTVQKKHQITEVFKTYGSLIEFFTDGQKQMVYFIQGLMFLNDEVYNKASDEFYKALSLGRKDRDVFVQQYLVEALVRQYKFIDSYRICSNIIKEFEERTIYMRAMKSKLQLARIYYHIAKNDEVYEITDNVERFAYKYNVHELIEECVMFRSAIEIRNKNYDKAEELLKRMPDQKSLRTILLRFKISYQKSDIEGLRNYFKKIKKFDSIKENNKVWSYLQVQAMSKLPNLFDEEKYLQLLNNLMNTSTMNNDQEMITISCNYLISYYHQERSYKKALEYAERFLHFKKIRIEKEEI